MSLNVIINRAHCSPFGSPMSERTWSGDYRYGFNGKEKDDESFAGAYDFGARILDTRLGRWLSVDANASRYSSESPYLFGHNCPLIFIDPNGKDAVITINNVDHTVVLESTVYLHGNLSTEEMKNLEKSYNDAFNSLDNSTIVQDPNNPEVEWTVTVKVTFVYDETINQACETLGLNSENVSSGDWEKLEASGELKLEEGSNILTISDNVSGAEGFTHQGGNEGIAGKEFQTVIHEVGHQLGFDERYMAKHKDENGNLQFGPYFPIHCEVGGFDLGTDMMSNRPITENKMPQIGGFHYVDILDCAIELSKGMVIDPSKSITFTLGSCSEAVESVIENSDGSTTVKSTTVFHDYKLDDTGGGSVDFCRDAEKKMTRVVNK